MLRRRNCVQKQRPNQIANWSCCRRQGPEEAILVFVIRSPRNDGLKINVKKNSKVTLDCNFRESLKTLKSSEELQSNIQNWSRKGQTSPSQNYSLNLFIQLHQDRCRPRVHHLESHLLHHPQDPGEVRESLKGQILNSLFVANSE